MRLPRRQEGVDLTREKRLRVEHLVQNRLGQLEHGGTCRVHHDRSVRVRISEQRDLADHVARALSVEHDRLRPPLYFHLHAELARTHLREAVSRSLLPVCENYRCC